MSVACRSAPPAAEPWYLDAARSPHTTYGSSPTGPDRSALGWDDSPGTARTTACPSGCVALAVPSRPTPSAPTPGCTAGRRSVPGFSRTAVPRPTGLSGDESAARPGSVPGTWPGPWPTGRCAWGGSVDSGTGVAWFVTLSYSHIGYLVSIVSRTPNSASAQCCNH